MFSFFFYTTKFFFQQSGAAGFRSGVLVAQLDKASDYESEDWGFKSLQGYFFIFDARHEIAAWLAHCSTQKLPCLDARVV